MSKPKKSYNIKKPKKKATAKKSTAPKKQAAPAKKEETPAEEPNTQSTEPQSPPEIEENMPKTDAITPEEKENLQQHKEFRDSIAADMMPEKEELPDSQELDPMAHPRIEREKLPQDTEPSQPPLDEPFTPTPPADEPLANDDFTPTPPDAPSAPSGTELPPVDFPTMSDLPSPQEGPDAFGQQGLDIPQGSIEKVFDHYFNLANHGIKKFAGGLVGIKIVKKYKILPELPIMLREHNNIQAAKLCFDEDDKKLLRQPTIDFLRYKGKQIDNPETRFYTALAGVALGKVPVFYEIRQENQVFKKEIELRLAEAEENFRLMNLQMQKQQQQPQQQSPLPPPPNHNKPKDKQKDKNKPDNKNNQPSKPNNNQNNNKK